jgi:hypothetical protein
LLEQSGDNGESTMLDSALTDDLICTVLSGEPCAWPLAVDDTAMAEQVCMRARQHGVQSLLHDALKDSAWPAAVLVPLRSAAMELAMWELRHQQVLVETLAALARAGVEPVLIKGTALAYSVYEGPALRTRGDTDLIIAPGHQQVVHELLLALGFRRQPGMSGQFVSYQASYTRVVPGGGAHTLDVHWKINNSQVLAHLFTHADLRRDAQPLPQLGPFAFGASPVDALLLACMHRLTHIHQPHSTDGLEGLGADRLVWLVDLHVLAPRLTQSEWATFLAKAREKGLRAVCRSGLEAAQVHFGTHVPGQVMDALAAHGADEAPALYLSAGRWHQRWLDFCSLPGSGGRFTYLRETLFPPAAYMRSRLRWAHGWLPWLYFRRAARGLAKALLRKSAT